jgi:hypothetical protein
LPLPVSEKPNTQKQKASKAEQAIAEALQKEEDAKDQWRRRTKEFALTDPGYFVQFLSAAEVKYLVSSLPT